MPRAKPKPKQPPDLPTRNELRLLDANAKLLGALDYCLDFVAIHQTAKHRLLKARAEALALVAKATGSQVKELAPR